MNRIYKVVWSKTKNCYVVASEFAKTAGKSKVSGVSVKKAVTLAALLATTSLVGTTTYAAVTEQPAVTVSPYTNPKTQATGVIVQDKSSQALAGDAGANSVALAGSLIKHDGNGDNTTASDHAVAIAGSEASGESSVAIGGATIEAGGYTVAIGGAHVGHAWGAIGLGKTTVNGQNAIGIGPGSITGGKNNDGAIAIGNNANANTETALGYGAIAIGRNAKATGQAGWGDPRTVTWTDSTGATQSTATGNSWSSLALGTNAQAIGIDGTTALGGNAVASGERAMAVGVFANATNKWATAVGTAAAASGYNSLAVGTVANASAERTTSIGSNTDATGLAATAVGDAAQATGKNSLAGGASANASGDFATAIGNNSKATDFVAAAFGQGSEAKASSALALGYVAQATAQKTVAIGDHATASDSDTIAIGTKALANVPSSVAIGAEAQTQAVVATTSSTVKVVTKDAVTGLPVSTTTSTLNYAGTTPVGTVSIGMTGKERTITNVAAGRVSNTSTDAINGSQLYALGTVVDTNTSSIANIGSTVNKGLNFKGDTGTVINKKLGDQLNILGGATTSTTQKNIAVTNENGDLRVRLANKIQLDNNGSFTVGSTVINNGGVTTPAVTTSTINVTNGPTINGAGINMNGDGITNLKSGLDGSPTEDTNAANIGDVKNIAKSEAAKADTDIHVKDGSYAVKDNTVDMDLVDKAGSTVGKVQITDVASAKDLSDVTDTVNKGTKHEGDVLDPTVTGKTNNFQQALGETTKIVGGVKDATKLTDNNIGVVSNGTDTLTVKLAKNIDLTKEGSVTTGATKVDNDGVKVTDKTNPTTGTSTALTNTGITITPSSGSTVSLTDKGLDNGDNQIKNVKSGLDGANVSTVISTVTAGGSTAYDTNGANIGDVINISNNIASTVASSAASSAVSTVLSTAEFGLQDDNGTPLNQNLNHQIQIVGNGNISTTVIPSIASTATDAAKPGKLQISLGNDITVGKKGEPGKEGTDGKIGVNGADGSSVVINGHDGSIGLHGQAGKDGMVFPLKVLKDLQV